MSDNITETTSSSKKITPELSRRVWNEAFEKTRQPITPYQSQEIVAHHSGIAYEVIEQKDNTVLAYYLDPETGQRITIEDKVENFRPDSIRSVYGSLIAQKIGKTTVSLDPKQPFLLPLKEIQISFLGKIKKHFSK